MPPWLRNCAPYGLLILLFISTAVFRPLLPVDETRYMTVAWEMFLRKEYFVLSLNFSPYHHKPPLLFWLINSCWEIFGIHRWTAMIPVFMAAASVLALTKALASRLFIDDVSMRDKIPWLMLGALPFLIYSSLIMFDLMLTAIILGVFILVIDYARSGKIRCLILAGLLAGTGVLVKGPVTYLYILWPMILYGLWRNQACIETRKLQYGIMVLLGSSFVPVVLWLGPVLLRMDHDFAYWLVWEQTAGRVSGNFNAAHVRPFYFYLYILPLLFLPWAFLPTIWKNISRIDPSNPGYRFILAYTLPVFISFSLIAGKQPHYLLPLLPAIIIALAHIIANYDLYKIIRISMAMVFLVVGGQGVAARYYFQKYDLATIASFMSKYKQADWVFVRNYQGELGYLARLEKPVDTLTHNELKGWFERHPEGYAVIRYGPTDNLDGYQMLYSQLYRGKMMGIFQR